MTVLVTGATGFVGAALVPALQRAGHDVRAFARRPDRLTTDVPVVVGDADTGAGLDAALEGVDVAYYLMHSMEAAPGPASFAARERDAVRRFVAAAGRQGVRRAVYLGGAVPGEGAPSRHLSSRLLVERELLAGFEEAVALRASIVIGARSRSFRILVRLVERLPAVPLPPWRDRRSAPIDQRDVVAMLVAAASTDRARGGMSLDAAGPDIVTYAELLEQIADALVLRRPTVHVGASATALTGRLAAVLTGEDHALIGPLMESLEMDLLPRSDDAAALLGVRRHSLARAVEHALAAWERVEPLAAR